MKTCVLAREVSIVFWREEISEKMNDERCEGVRCRKRVLVEVLDRFIESFTGGIRLLAPTRWQILWRAVWCFVLRSNDIEHFPEWRKGAVWVPEE